MSPAAAKSAAPKVSLKAANPSTAEAEPEAPVGTSRRGRTAAAALADGEDLDAADLSLEESADALLAAAALPAAESLATTRTVVDDKPDLRADAKARALASIKVGPKGVYTEGSMRV